MSSIRRLAFKHLPLPPVLKRAEDQGHARRIVSPDGGVGFVILRHCPDRRAVLQALERRQRWHRRVRRAAGVVASVALVALGYWWNDWLYRMAHSS